MPREANSGQGHVAKLAWIRLKNVPEWELPGPWDIASPAPPQSVMRTIVPGYMRAPRDAIEGLLGLIGGPLARKLLASRSPCKIYNP